MRAAVREMHVSIVESRQQSAALGIDDCACGVLAIAYLPLAPTATNAAVEHRQRFSLRLLQD